MPWRASRLNVFVSLADEKFVSPSKMDEYIGSVKSKGGILADAVGLGKTFESMYPRLEHAHGHTNNMLCLVIGLALTSYTKEKLPDVDAETGLLNTKATLGKTRNPLVLITRAKSNVIDSRVSKSLASTVGRSYR